MRIPELKEKVRMEDVLLHYSAEISYRSWNTWESLSCPFHDDRQASASVNLAEDRFKCHGCEISGDVLDVVMEVEGLTLGEARKFLEDNFVEASG